MDDPPAEPGLARSALRQTNDIARDHPLWLAVGIGVAALVLVLGVVVVPGAAWLNAALTLASTFLVILVIFLVQCLNVHVKTEVRKAVEARLGPEGTSEPEPANFTCTRLERPNGQIDLTIANHDAPGRFSVRIVDVDGLNEQHDTPWTVPWGDDGAGVADVGHHDERTITLVHVRYIGRLDFKQVHGGGTRLVSPGAACETEPCTVRVGLEVRNDVGGESAKQAFTLPLVLRDGDPPISRVGRLEPR